jgi:hypothetical protein
MTWLTPERRAAWPFPQTAEEQRLCEAGLPWQHLRTAVPAARVPSMTVNERQFGA